MLAEEQATPADLGSRVRAQFALVLDVPISEVSDDGDFYDDLDGDSLQKLELTARVEEEFATKLTDEEVADLRTVNDFSRVLAARLGG